MDELQKLAEWLLAMDPKEHYCGFELDFGIERSEILEYIADRLAAAPVDGDKTAAQEVPA
jgi:hypothetical protein